MAIPTSKKLHRFYEPLVLLHTLGTARGEHTHKTLSPFEDSDSFTGTELTRQFLNELCFLCDYKKGGDTCTAIGLEQTPQGCVFWVAANKCPEKRIVPFLEDLLTRLGGARDENGYDLAEDILRISVLFARSRINTYTINLVSALETLKTFPACSDTEIASEIMSWIDMVDRIGEDTHSLVKFAYDKRHSHFRKLKTIAREPRYKTSEDDLQARFKSVRHTIGRLGLHCRSARALVQYTPRMMHLLESAKVQAVPRPTKGMGIPLARNKTTLEGVLKRMLPKDDPNLERLLHALTAMDKSFQLSKRLIEAYNSSSSKARVHAEVQVLDHFHEQDLVFAENDKYIACSKPACFCCRLFFRYHPGGFVEPPSHQKVYLHWQPPGVLKDNEAKRKTSVWTVLDRMLRDIRDDALRQIIDRTPPRGYHPDSVTGISATNIAKSELDDSSIIGYGEGGSEFTNGSGDDSSFGSESSTGASSSEVQLSLDSDTNDEEEDGGVSLLGMDGVSSLDFGLPYHAIDTARTV